MRNTLWKIIPTLFAFLIITVTAIAQTKNFKVGDKVDADLWGKWYRGYITRLDGDYYIVKLEATGSDVMKTDKEVRRSINPTAKPVGDKGNLQFNIGDKVEADVFGTWVKGTVADYDAGMYKILVDGRDPKASGSELLKEEKEVRAAQAGGGGTAINNQPKEVTDNSPCADWSAWGIINKTAFMKYAAEKYSTGFSMSTPDLICQVKTRKVDFQLTADEIATVNSLRNSPELIQALRDNYKGEKIIARTTASAIKQGHYSCGKMLLGGYRKRDDLFILPNSQYRTESSSEVGKYSFNAATNEITWSSGAYRKANMTGVYEISGKDATITLYNTSGQIEHACNWIEK
jgi:hypothetical protein